MPKFCPSCGSPLQNENANHCPNCGAAIQARPAPVQPVTPQPVPVQPAPVQPVVQQVQAELPKNTIIAALLSFFFPGLGQVYNGDLKRGAMFLVGTFVGLLLVILPGLIVWVYQLYDAYSTSNKMNAGLIPVKHVNVMEVIVYFVLWIIGLVVLFVGIIVLLMFVTGASLLGSAAVFDMAGNIQHTKSVTATVQQTDSNHLTFTYWGGADAGSLRLITVRVTDGSGYTQTKYIGQPGQSDPVQIGSEVILTGAFSGKEHAVATGKFDDGSEQVILDTYI